MNDETAKKVAASMAGLGEALGAAVAQFNLAKPDEDDVKQLAMFSQAVDARENGYLDAGVWHPTWDEASPAHPTYLAEARRTLTVVLTLGYHK
jgi:hypothetical protein